MERAALRRGLASDHGHGSHGHGHHVSGPSPRIRSSALLTTVGGLEDHPFFAEALLDRARALSKRATDETIILVAHGSGDDRQNDHWRELLASVARQMHEKGGSEFRRIQFGTWREDWEDKRAPELAAIRGMVEEASKEGRALVIPARTTGEGFERRFLQGLQYELGSGFAPHPLFVRWVEEQISVGISALQKPGVHESCSSHQARR